MVDDDDESVCEKERYTETDDKLRLVSSVATGTGKCPAFHFIMFSILFGRARQPWYTIFQWITRNCSCLI